MSDHTPDAGTLPNAAIDFNKAHKNAMAGRKSVYGSAINKTVPTSALPTDDDDDDAKLVEASRTVAAQEAGFDSHDDMVAATAPDVPGVPSTK